MKNAKYLYDTWMQNFAANTPAGIALASQNEQTIDATLYAAKSINAATSIDTIFATDDSLATALTNVANAQLPANQYFMITAIQVLYAVAAGTTATNVKEADYSTVIPAEILAGELSITTNKKPLVDKLSLYKFDTADNYVATGDTNASAATPVTYTMVGRGNVGYYELECPKMIKPQEVIEVKMKFAKAAASNAAIKVIFHGVTNITA